VCDVADCDDVDWDDVAWDDVVEVVAGVATESPDVEAEVAAAVGVVVVLWPSRQASTPPSESIAATLIAVAAFRARAARGVRFRRSSCAGRSSMTVNVRTCGE
jgi:hypothetical protein